MQGHWTTSYFRGAVHCCSRLDSKGGWIVRLCWLVSGLVCFDRASRRTSDWFPLGPQSAHQVPQGMAAMVRTPPGRKAISRLGLVKGPPRFSSAVARRAVATARGSPMETPLQITICRPRPGMSLLSSRWDGIFSEDSLREEGDSSLGSCRRTPSLLTWQWPAVAAATAAGTPMETPLQHAVSSLRLWHCFCLSRVGRSLGEDSLREEGDSSLGSCRRTPSLFDQ